MRAGWLAGKPKKAIALQPPLVALLPDKGAAMGALKSIIGTILGSALYLVVLCIMTLSLPFNVIALMHLWGYEWWSALLIAVFINAVPAVGQLAYIVFAVMGAFLLLSGRL